METTTIRISHSTWEKLNQEKSVGESFEDVILELLKIKKEVVKKD